MIQQIIQLIIQICRHIAEAHAHPKLIFKNSFQLIRSFANSWTVKVYTTVQYLKYIDYN